VLVCLSLPSSICCAWLSWNLIEHPILSRKKLILAKVHQAWEIILARARTVFFAEEA
jgi:peptidoglycan/LPS O-acetylase OafA/YrhL